MKPIYYRNIRIEKAARIQEEYNATIAALDKYKPKKLKYINDRRELLINGQNFYDGREMIIEAFKNKIFPMIPTGFDSDEDEMLRMSPDEDEIPRMSPGEDELSKQYDELYKAISNVDSKLDSELIRKYFNKGSLLELFNF